MTRINYGIEPAELCDKHLIAEYRESMRISSGAWLAFQRGEKPEDMPQQFALGRGHVLFFCTLGGYMHLRFDSLVREMRHRGFTTNYPLYRSHPVGWNRGSEPTDDDIAIVRARIIDRLPANARWTRRQPPAWVQHSATF